MQKWMAMVLGLLSRRSGAVQVIYAMRSRPQSQAQICVKWPEGGGRKGSGICSTAAALALRLLDGVRGPAGLAACKTLAKQSAIFAGPFRYEIAPNSHRNRALTAPHIAARRDESCEPLRSASSRASLHCSLLHSKQSRCIRADGPHSSSHRCSQPQKLSTWC